MGTIWQGYAQDHAGNVLPGATITVRLQSSGALAIIKPNKDLSGTLGNPFTADANGKIVFYASAGLYRIAVTSGEFSEEFVNVALGTAQERNVGTGDGQIPLNSDLGDAARSNDYGDLDNKPVLGTMAAKVAGTGGDEYRSNTQNDGQFFRIGQNLAEGVASAMRANTATESTEQLNARDTANRSRTNHTDTQPPSTLTLTQHYMLIGDATGLGSEIVTGAFGRPFLATATPAEGRTALELQQTTVAIEQSIGLSTGYDVAHATSAARQIDKKELLAFAIGSGESSSLSASYNFSRLDGTGLFSTNTARNRGWLAAATGSNYIEIVLPFGVIIGDSIAEGHPNVHGRLHQSYEDPTFNDAILNEFGTPAFELSRRTGLHWYNHGIGGQNSQQILERFSRDALGDAVDVGDGRPTTTLPSKPVWVWVNAGINDVSALTDTLVTKSNLLQMALLAFKAGVKIGFNTIGPVNGHDAAQRAMQDDINQYILTVLPLYGAHVFDFHSWFVDPANPAVINPLYNADGVHPSKIGYMNCVSRLLSDPALQIYLNGLTVDSLGESYSANYRAPTSIEFESESGLSETEPMTDQFGYYNPRMSVLTTPKIKIYVRNVSGGVDATKHSGISNVYGVIGYQSQKGIVPYNKVKRQLGGTLIKLSGTWQVWSAPPAAGVASVVVNVGGDLGVYVTFDRSVFAGIASVGSSTTKFIPAVIPGWPSVPSRMRVRLFDMSGTELNPASVADNTAFTISVSEA
jgi:lysophospholipase L1-like esterase